MRLGKILVTPLRHRLAGDMLSLFLRIALAAPFWLSGRTKIEDGTLLQISETTFFLFENEYSAVPLPPQLAAILATSAEHALPLLLVAGLATRAAAFGLMAMTMVIQIFVYPDAWWNVHMQWFGLGLAVLVLGPGRLSLDHAAAGRH